jgi:hypothetical protein
VSHPAEEKSRPLLPKEASVLDLRDARCSGWFLGLRGMTGGIPLTPRYLGREGMCLELDTQDLTSELPAVGSVSTLQTPHQRNPASIPFHFCQTTRLVLVTW